MIAFRLGPLNLVCTYRVLYTAALRTEVQLGVNVWFRLLVGSRVQLACAGPHWCPPESWSNKPSACPLRTKCYPARIDRRIENHGAGRSLGLDECKMGGFL
jgi:hypothetical protein